MPSARDKSAVADSSCLGMCWCRGKKFFLFKIRPLGSNEGLSGLGDEFGAWDKSRLFICMVGPNQKLASAFILTGGAEFIYTEQLKIELNRSIA